MTAPLLGMWVRIPLEAWMSVSCECFVLSGRCLCVGLITRPGESYQVWCVWVWSWILDNEEALAHWGLLRHGKKSYLASVVDEWNMGMNHWLNDADKENSKYSKITPFQCHSVNYKHHTDWPASKHQSNFKIIVSNEQRPVRKWKKKQQTLLRLCRICPVNISVLLWIERKKTAKT